MSDAAADLSNLSSRAWAIIGVVTAFFITTLLSVSLRIYVRGFMIRSFGWDDWLILVSLVFFFVQGSYSVMISHNELNGQLTQLKPLYETVQYIVLEFAWYICTMLFLKLSLAVFFLRVCIERWQRWTIYIVTALYTLYTIGYLFVAVFQCGNPVDFLVHELKNECIPWSILSPLNYTHASLNAITDWVCAILPIFVLQRSNMPTKAKWSVCGLMVLGALGSVCSLVRLAYIQILHNTNFTFFRQSTSITIVSIIECGLGITAASLATLRPLFHSCIEHHRNSRQLARSSDQNRQKSDPEQGSSTAGGAVARVWERHGEFASYGFTDYAKSKTVKSGASSSDELELADLSGFASDLPFDGRPQFPGRTESNRTELLDDLHAARAAYEERKWTGHNEFVEPNLLLPDI